MTELLRDLKMTDYKKMLICFMLKEIQFRFRNALDQYDSIPKDYLKNGYLFATFTRREAETLIDPSEYKKVFNYLIKKHIIYPNVFYKDGQAIDKEKVHRGKKWKLASKYLTYDFNRFIDYDNPRISDKLSKWKLSSLKTSLTYIQFRQCIFECGYDFDKRLLSIDTFPDGLLDECITYHFEKHPEIEKCEESISEYVSKIQNHFCGQVEKYMSTNDPIKRLVRTCSSPEYFNNKITRCYTLLNRVPSPFLHYLLRDGKKMVFLDIDAKYCHPSILHRDLKCDRNIKGYSDWTFCKVMESDTDIYEYISEQLNDTRTISKHIFNSFINGEIGLQVTHQLRDIFPDLVKWVINLKKATEWKDKFIDSKISANLSSKRGYKILGDKLRHEESEFIYSQYLSVEGIPQIIKHDGAMIQVTKNFNHHCNVFRYFTRLKIGKHTDSVIKKIYGEVSDNDRIILEKYIEKFNQ